MTPVRNAGAVRRFAGNWPFLVAGAGGTAGVVAGTVVGCGRNGCGKHDRSDDFCIMSVAEALTATKPPRLTLTL